MGAGLEVELLVCSVGFRLVRRKNALDDGEKETKGVPRRARGAHLEVCTHTRVTRMLGLHPSHESKLFETEERDTERRARTGPKGKRQKG